MAADNIVARATGGFAGCFTLMVALFNFGFAFALFRRQEVDRTLVYFLIGLVVTFVSLAGPVQLEGNHITLFWAAEAALRVGSLTLLTSLQGAKRRSNSVLAL